MVLADPVKFVVKWEQEATAKAPLVHSTCICLAMHCAEEQDGCKQEDASSPQNTDMPSGQHKSPPGSPKPLQGTFTPQPSIYIPQSRA